MSRMGARWGRNLTGVCPSAALDSLPPSEPRAPFPATAVGATSVAVAFPSLLLPQTAADRACRPPARAASAGRADHAEAAAGFCFLRDARADAAALT